jgi:hypothetical protein
MESPRAMPVPARDYGEASTVPRSSQILICGLPCYRNYESSEYKPRDAEIRYFLMQFVTRHYGRRRVAVREDDASSLYSLDGRLADSIIESTRRLAAQSLGRGNGVKRRHRDQAPLESFNPLARKPVSDVPWRYGTACPVAQKNFIYG